MPYSIGWQAADEGFQFGLGIRRSIKKPFARVFADPMPQDLFCRSFLKLNRLWT
jgi:hypothetical protein